MKTLLYGFLGIGLVLILIIIAFNSCVKEAPKKVQPKTTAPIPEWVKNSIIYEVNLRQYSKEGTFAAFQNDLPRLKELGVDVLWFMPIHPIGKEKRKGTLGSYYSVMDYKATNPEFGTMDDFKRLVNETHQIGMKIIIDWVPNHTSWDNHLFKANPEFYSKDSTGKPFAPFGWEDVVQLDYTNPMLREYMIETMKFWLTETNIDGFRCDVAWNVPVDFWDTCRKELESVKSIFFLAEADKPELQVNAFDMGYDWKFHHLMNDVAKGKKKASAITKHFNWVDSVYSQGTMLLQFTSNHDENSWNGTEFERLGQGAQTFAVLAATVPGSMLVYNGQEAAFNRRLKFFDKDSIDWAAYQFSEFYRKLINIKKNNQSLWDGFNRGSFQPIGTTNPRFVYAFQREFEDNQIVTFFNLSGQDRLVAITTDIPGLIYKDLFTNKEYELKKYKKMLLKPWEYLVLKAL